MKRKTKQPPLSPALPAGKKETKLGKLLAKLRHEVESYQDFVREYNGRRRELEHTYADKLATLRSEVIKTRQHVEAEVAKINVPLTDDKSRWVKWVGNVSITIRKKIPSIIILNEEALIEALEKDDDLAAAIIHYQSVDRNTLKRRLRPDEVLNGMEWGTDESLTIDLNLPSLETEVIPLLKGIPFNPVQVNDDVNEVSFTDVKN